MYAEKLHVIRFVWLMGQTNRSKAGVQATHVTTEQGLQETALL